MLRFVLAYIYIYSALEQTVDSVLSRFVVVRVCLCLCLYVCVSVCLCSCLCVFYVAT